MLLVDAVDHDFLFICDCGLIGTNICPPFCLNTSQYNPLCFTTKMGLLFRIMKHVTGYVTYVQLSQKIDCLLSALFTIFAEVYTRK